MSLRIYEENQRFLSQHRLEPLLARLIEQEKNLSTTIEDIKQEAAGLQADLTAEGQQIAKNTADLTAIESVLKANQSGAPVSQEDLDAALAALQTLRGASQAQTAQLAGDDAAAEAAAAAPPVGDGTTGS